MDFLLWYVVLLNVSSLVEAELNYWKGGHYETTKKERKEEMLKGLILSLHHVKKLQIGYLYLATLARLEAKVFTFPSNVEHPDWPDYDSSGSEDCYQAFTNSSIVAAKKVKAFDGPSDVKAIETPKESSSVKPETNGSAPVKAPTMKFEKAWKDRRSWCEKA
ncbi:hypothetical protein Tco_0984938 [Tanacetum coccineum]